MIEEITKRLVDDGLLIEAGWVGMKMMSISDNAPKIQIDEMRMAFFAGAQHLWGSIMTVLEPDAEPTENDLKRMDLIHKELEQFLAQYKARHNL
jgi:biotin synthase-like enzyme